jgi:hypothetical protein
VWRSRGRGFIVLHGPPQPRSRNYGNRPLHSHTLCGVPVVQRTRKLLGLGLIVVAGCSDAGRASDDSEPATAASLPGSASPSIARSTPSPIPQEPESIQTFGRVLPFDEAGKDSTLLSFRQQLQSIVAARDGAALMAASAADVASSLGGDDGKEQFRARWRPEDPSSTLWPFLEDLLRRGGRFIRSDLFIAPYAATGLPDSLDVESFAFALDSNVAVRVAPDSGARVFARLTFDVVRVAPEPWRGLNWLALQATDSALGYVEARQIGGPMGPRVGLAREQGRWVLKFLLEGSE